MSERLNHQVKRSHIVIGIVISIVAAVAMPIMMLSIGTIYVYPLLTLIITAFTTPVTGAISMLLDLVAAELYMGMPGSLAFAIAFILPTAFMIRAYKNKRSFGEQVIISLFYLTVGTLVTIIAARIYIGKSIIDAFSELIGKYLSLLNPQIIDRALVQVYSIEGVEASISDISKTLLTDMQRVSYLDKLISDIHNSLAVTLPGSLLSSVYLTGVLTPFIANLIGRKNLPRSCYVPLSDWFTPYRITLGITVLLVISLICDLISSNFGDVFFNTVSTIATSVFMIQAASSMERHMKISGRGVGIRIVFILLSELLLPDIMALYGAASAIFGSKGAGVQLKAHRQ